MPLRGPPRSSCFPASFRHPRRPVGLRCIQRLVLLLWRLSPPGLPSRQLLPDFFAYFQIDVYVGAGCGYAGTISGPGWPSSLADCLRWRGHPDSVLRAAGLGISLIVNGLLLFMSII